MQIGRVYDTDCDKKHIYHCDGVHADFGMPDVFRILYFGRPPLSAVLTRRRHDIHRTAPRHQNKTWRRFATPAQKTGAAL
jgi:hypothetical protein